MRLLTTKFHTPPWRASGVSRPRLLERLDAGLHENRKLTLVSAPAGYGKTTLVAEWLHMLDGRRKTAWLSLDDADNEIERLLRYWLGAFQSVDDGVGEKIREVLSLPQLPPASMVMDELLNELARLETPILLVLDDYHVITNAQVHSALEYFINHQPAQLHLVLTTRADPPLPLARLRARGQMTEIRARDLRFTPQEAQAFFSQSMNLDLAQDAANALDERAEGWAAGLQLAGVALQNLADRQRFIETFRGSHRYILDYLAEEVIRQQGEAMRAFLAQTCILERFNADVCQALTGREDAQAAIAHLEQANLFIIPLDDDCVWYRYHHLFSDFLRTLLSRADQTELYKKASVWHEGTDLVFDAVRYALASGDSEFAADAIERAVQKETTWSGGDVTLLAGWLEALPAQALYSRPRLGLSASRILYLSGRFDQAESCIAQTEQALKSQPATGETEQMLAIAALYRGCIAAVRGEVRQAIEQISAAQARIAPENHLVHARGYYGLGLAYEISDQNELAVRNYLRSSEEAQAAGVQFLAIHAMCGAAQVQVKQGRLRLARQTCQAALRTAGNAHIPPLGLAWIILGGIALEQNDLAPAEQLIQDGVALARRGGLLDDVILGMAHLSRLRAIQGRPAEAFAAFEEANANMQAFGVHRMSLRASAHLARLQLFCGQIQAAAEWAGMYRAARSGNSEEFEDLTLARILLAGGEAENARAILQPILEKANAAGRLQTSIEAMALLALCCQAVKDIKTAVVWLGKALALAAPEGYVRLFLDEGQPMLDLLPKARSATPELVDSLLGVSRPAPAPQAAPAPDLLDPLSEQELRVLRLVMAGRSNQEIADELYISVGTAKWHIHNILQKLGVGSRAQAIARALELGIK